MFAVPAPICILDDDAAVLRSIERLLESDGLAAQVFEHADDFLNHAHQHEVKVAVLDVFIGGVSGLEVQRRLRRFSPLTEVIVITGLDLPGLRSQALENGARAFLVKPFEDETFLTHVHDALAAAS